MLNAKITPDTSDNGDLKAHKSKESHPPKSRDDGNIKAPRIVFKGGHTSAVLSVAVLEVPGKKDILILSSSEDRTAAVWSLRTGLQLASMKGHLQRVPTILGYASTQHEPVAVTGSWDETIRVWPLNSCFDDKKKNSVVQLESTVLKGHKNRIYSIDILNVAEPLICSGSADGFVIVWSLVKEKVLLRIINANNIAWILSVAAFIHPHHGPALLTGGKDAALCMWPIQVPPVLSDDVMELELTPLLSIAHPSRIHSIAVYFNKKVAIGATVCRDFEIRVFNLITGGIIRSLKGHGHAISDLSICQKTDGDSDDEGYDNVILISASANGNMRVWSLSSGEMLRIFRGHTESVCGVTCFQSPSNANDIVMISSSADTTVRSWLFMEQRFLRVLEHGAKIRINAIDVCSISEDFVVVTGADDGCIRAWKVTYASKDILLYTKNVHKQRIKALKIYTPAQSGLKWNGPGGQSHLVPIATCGLDLSSVLIISGGRNAEIRFNDFRTGNDVGPVLQGHTNVISALCVCNCVKTMPSASACKEYGYSISPFLVSGSEDNTLRVWSLVDGSCLRVLSGHEFDVTDVRFYIPLNPSVYGDQILAIKGTVEFGALSSQSRMDTNLNISEMLLSPIIISSSMDNRVILWSYDTGNMIAVLGNSQSAVTSVATLELPMPIGPIIAAGCANGKTLLWSLLPPYQLKHEFVGHTDEIQSITTYDAEGVYPVLVTGSYDTTVRIWSLTTFKAVRTLEGHTSEVTSLCVFSPGGTDPVVASASTDTTVRIMIDFLASVSNEDYVAHCYNYDLNGVNCQSLTEDDIQNAFDPRWWRISQLVRDEGPDDFFLNYSELFFTAIADDASHFLQVFLSLSPIAVIKTNTPKGPKGSLLRYAINNRDTKSVRAFISAWIILLTTKPHDPDLRVYDPSAKISMSDLLLLAEKFPKEFERLICSLQLIAAKNNLIPDGSRYLYEDHDKNIEMDVFTSSTDGDSDRIKTIYMYLPVDNLIHIDVLKAMTDTCETLDSVKIFDSDAGQFALAAAWRSFGRKTHVLSMSIYFSYVLLATTSIYTFKHLRLIRRRISVGLIVIQFIYEAYFVYREKGQLLLTPMDFLTDVWNLIDATVISCSIAGNICRLVAWDDTSASRVLLSIASIVMWFNVLFYLRAFESTGVVAEPGVQISYLVM